MLKITCPKGERIKICAVLPYTVHMACLLINMGRFKVHRQFKMWTGFIWLKFEIVACY